MARITGIVGLELAGVCGGRETDGWDYLGLSWTVYVGRGGITGIMGGEVWLGWDYWGLSSLSRRVCVNMKVGKSIKVIPQSYFKICIAI
jgi:hypothetical protein